MSKRIDIPLYEDESVIANIRMQKTRVILNVIFAMVVAFSLTMVVVSDNHFYHNYHTLSIIFFIIVGVFFVLVLSCTIRRFLLTKYVLTNQRIIIYDYPTFYLQKTSFKYALIEDIETNINELNRSYSVLFKLSTHKVNLSNALSKMDLYPKFVGISKSDLELVIATLNKYAHKRVYNI